VLLRLLIRRTGQSAVADVDIALFFFTTRVGVLALVLVGALILAVTALEQACLMTIVLAALRGARPRVRDAIAHAVARAFRILRLTAMIVARRDDRGPVRGRGRRDVLGPPDGHDINFYLAERPPAFAGAVAIATVVVVALAFVLARKR
jgi:glycerophosphoryl diester phosphodiesterase